MVMLIYVNTDRFFPPLDGIARISSSWCLVSFVPQNIQSARTMSTPVKATNVLTPRRDVTSSKTVSMVQMRKNAVSNHGNKHSSKKRTHRSNTMSKFISIQEESRQKNLHATLAANYHFTFITFFFISLRFLRTSNVVELQIDMRYLFWEEAFLKYSLYNSN